MFKKLCSFVLCLAMILSMSVSAFAVSGSKSVSGYGTLKGTLAYPSLVKYSTSVTKNPDNAVLTFKIQYINSAGDSLKTSSAKSKTGKTNLTGSLSAAPSGTSTIYSTHGVQGGSKYSAKAVYLKYTL